MNMEKLGARQGILSVNVKEKNALFEAYMPFLKNGGLFVPTKKKYRLGDEVFVLLTLMEEKEKIPFSGRIVWLTPKAAQGNRTPGIGVQFGDDNAGKMVRSKIETYLAGALKSERHTQTM